MAYTNQARTAPSGSQTGTVFSASVLATTTALQDQILSGLGQGWTYSQTPGTGSDEEPQYIYCTNVANTSIIFRCTPTWTSGNMTGATFALSTNGGSAYDTIGSAATFSYTSGNLTASTQFGGLFAKFAMEARGKLKALKSAYDTHAGLQVASAPHGVGTIASQNANAVAITGGSVKCTYEREAKLTSFNGNAGNTLSWVTGGILVATVTGASCAITMSNLPTGEVGYMTFDLTDAGKATTLIAGLKWPGGAAVTFSNPGRDILTLMCHDGATLNVVGMAKGMA